MSEESSQTGDPKKIKAHTRRPYQSLRVVDRLSHNHRITAFATIFFFIFCGLGTWQLKRAEEKQAQIQEDVEVQSSVVPKTLIELKPNEPGQWTLLEGYFHPKHIVFLDNRTRESRRGYEVVQLFCDRQRCAWVNRGWVEHTDRTLPGIDTPKNRIQTTGYTVAVKPHGELVDNLQEVNAYQPWPMRVQWLDTKAINQHLPAKLNKPILSQSVRLTVESQYGFYAMWPKTGMTEEKHLGYAMQWFALALAAVLLQIFANSDAVYHWRHWRLRQKWWKYNENMGKKH